MTLRQAPHALALDKQGDKNPVMVNIARGRTMHRSPAGVAPLAIPMLPDRAGFTLIEIVIAIAVISIALVTLLSAMTRTVATAAENTVITKSVLLAQEKLTLLNREQYESSAVPVATDWLTDERYPTLTYKVDIEETQFPGASRVTVQVRRGGKKIFELESYLIKK